MGFWDYALPISTGGASLLFRGGGGGGGGGNLEDLLSVIDRYTYKPQYTGQTEQGLFDLFEQLTGRRGGVEQIPFDIGLPTTGLYDALTRGIKEDYLGTPGGPEGGRIADTRAYYNNLGIPEQAINQERLANRDLNNLLTDQAALINESQKDRLSNILNLGLQTGGNLYGQNLAQHRANAGLGLTAATADLGIQESIRQANQQSLNDLLKFGGALAGTYFGGPAGGSVGSQAVGGLNNLLNPAGNTSVYRGSHYSVPSLFGAAGSSSTPQSAKLL